MKSNGFFILVLGIFAGGMFLSVNQSARAADKNSDNRSAEQSEHPSQHAFLGVEIERLQRGMAGHLPNAMLEGQGVLINHVTAGSPAEKAGLKRHDILVQFGDQKIFAAEQLSKLIASDKPGKELEVTYVRGGKLNTTHVTLGTASEEMMNHFRNRSGGRDATNRVGQRWSNRPHEQASSRDGSNWDSFDSMTLKRQKDGTFQAEINYLDKDGKIEHHAFQGTRDEIERAIKSEKDLPISERHHLLHGLGPSLRGNFVPGVFQNNDGYWFELQPSGEVQPSGTEF